jgi:hypothetical protein
MEEVEAFSQGDLLQADTAPIAEPIRDEIPYEASPSFVASDDHRHKRGGLLSLFGGGRPRHDVPPAPLKDYRGNPQPVIDARARAVSSGQQSAVDVAQEEHMDAVEDLEIPSFLRRLAN